MEVCAYNKLKDLREKIHIFLEQSLIAINKRTEKDITQVLRKVYEMYRIQLVEIEAECEDFGESDDVRWLKTGRGKKRKHNKRRRSHRTRRTKRRTKRNRSRRKK